MDVPGPELYAPEVLEYFNKCSTVQIIEERYFPTVIHRDSTIHEICKAASDVLSIAAGNTGMQAWELPCLFTGSGAGKTFLNFFALSLVKNFLARHSTAFAHLRNSMTNCFRVYLKQVSVLSYSSFCQNLENSVKPSVRLYFKWFIASQLLLPQDDFKLHRPQISMFNRAMKKMEETGFLDKLDYSVVFAALRQKYGIAANAPIWIFVAHDEVQFLTKQETLLALKNNPDAKRETVLYQYLLESVNFAQTAKEYNIHVLNIYSGTLRLDITETLDPTGHRWKPIRLDPLTVEDGVALLSAKHPTLADKMNTPLFKIVLSHQGNIPRIWREYSKIISEEINPSLDATNLAHLNDLLEGEVKTTYGKEIHSELLLLLAMQGWMYYEASKLLPEPFMQHVSALQQSGLLFLVDQHFFVPPILLRSLTLNSQPNIKKIFTYFPDRMLSGTFTASDFEEFCIEFFTLKCNLFAFLGIHKLPLAEFFKGAWISNQAKALELTLTKDGAPRATMYKTHTATLKSLEKVRTGLGHEIKPKELVPVALWIGNNDPHQDGVLLLPDSLIQFEMKYSIGDAQQALQGKSSSSFENEQKKAESSPLRLKDKLNLFVYITNCRMTNDEDKRTRVQHPPSIIICSESFDRVFSPTFVYVTSHIKSKLLFPVETEQNEVQGDESEPTSEARPKQAKRTPKQAAKPRATKQSTYKKKQVKQQKANDADEDDLDADLEMELEMELDVDLDDNRPNRAAKSRSTKRSTSNNNQPKKRKVDDADLDDDERPKKKSNTSKGAK